MGDRESDRLRERDGRKERDAMNERNVRKERNEMTREGLSKVERALDGHRAGGWVG